MQLFASQTNRPAHKVRTGLHRDCCSPRADTPAEPPDDGLNRKGAQAREREFLNSLYTMGVNNMSDQADERGELSFAKCSSELGAAMVVVRIARAPDRNLNGHPLGRGLFHFCCKDYSDGNQGVQWAPQSTVGFLDCYWWGLGHNPWVATQPPPCTPCYPSSEQSQTPGPLPFPSRKPQRLAAFFRLALVNVICVNSSSVISVADCV
jgi:hypothetical protein